MPATLEIGPPPSTGPDVTTWQNGLNAAGFVTPVTGTFDGPTLASTISYQKSKGLTPDGIVGPKSWASMLGGTNTIGGGSGGGVTFDPTPAGPVAEDIAAVPGLAEHTDNAFRYAVAIMSTRLKVNPDYVVAAMAVETGKTFDPNVRNPLSGAVGLIQFMPKGSAASLTGLGAGGADFLGGLSQIEQLVYVEKYFKPFTGKMNSPADAYLAVFYPSAMGKPPDHVIANEGGGPGTTSSKVYEQNKGFDTAKKGYITAGDVGKAATYMLSQAEKVARLPITPEAIPTGEAGGGATPSLPAALSVVPKLGLLAVLLGGGYYLVANYWDSIRRLFK